jgi:2-methylaconitate cis-trans-isomerase PrpF
MMHRETTAFRTCIYRAGTSKGIFLHENDLPQDPKTRDQVILAIFGSPDKRQIDGLGGAEVKKGSLSEAKKVLLETIRKMAFDIMGKKYNEKDAVPFVAFVTEPMDYLNHLSGDVIQAKEVDFLSRVWFLGGSHQTYPGSISCCTGAAAVIPGTVVSEIRVRKDPMEVRIGHPAGTIDVEAVCEIDAKGQPVMKRVSYGRTARRLMDGYAYVLNSRFMTES